MTTPDSLPRRWTVPTAGAAAALVALAAATVAYALQGRANWGTDFMVYHQAGSAVLHGHSPYGTLNGQGKLFIYTPFSALVLTPLSLLGMDAALGVWTLISVLALQAVVWALLGTVGVASRARRAVLTLAITLLMLPSSPVLSNIWLGQINLILLLLVVGDQTSLPRRFRGAGIGVAAGLKLTPLIFIPYFLVTRRIREAVVAGVSFLATVAIGFVALPGASRTYWGGMFMDSSRGLPHGANLYNESLYGALSRPPLGSGTGWFVTAVIAVVGLAGLAIAARAARRGSEQAGFIACAVTALLVSPISWPAHWVWCVPILILWGHRVRLHGFLHEKVGLALFGVVVLASSYWMLVLLLDNGITSTLGRQVFANLFTVVGLLMLLALTVVPGRAARPAVLSEATASG